MAQSVYSDFKKRNLSTQEKVETEEETDDPKDDEDEEEPLF